jgi:hypothetical protein
VHGAGSVLEEALLEGWVEPRFGNDASATLRSELLLEVVEHPVDRDWVDDAAFDQQRFERLGAQRARVIVVVVFAHAGSR